MLEDKDNREDYMSKLKEIQSQMFELHQNMPSEHNQISDNTEITDAVTAIYDSLHTAYKEHYLKK